jgi:hypothetical protein
VRNDSLRWLDELEQSLPTVVVTANEGDVDVSDVSVSVDGARITERLDGRAFPMDPGEHVFVLERGGQSVTVPLVIAEGEKNRHVVAQFRAKMPDSIHPADRPRPETTSNRAGTRTVPFGLFALTATGGLALASFAFFGITGKSDLGHLRADCAPTCSDAAIATVKREMTIADVSLGVAIVSLTVAAVWFLARPQHSSQVGFR